MRLRRRMARLSSGFQAETASRPPKMCAVSSPFHEFHPARDPRPFSAMLRSVGAMHKILLSILHGFLSGFRTRTDLQLEVIALRHQLEVLRNNRRTRVRQTRLDRAFWILFYRFWARCLDAVVIVRPDTVVRWHRQGFRAFWTCKSRRRNRGHPPVPADIKNLIRRMSGENPLWGAGVAWSLALT